MRAHALLRTLALHYRVYLYITASPPPAQQTIAALTSLCAEVAFRPIGLWTRSDARLRLVMAAIPSLYRRLFPEPSEWTKAAQSHIANPFTVAEFDLAHVFRIYMIPILRGLQLHVRWQHAQLDIDDLESLTRKRLAALYRRHNDSLNATRMKIEARQYQDIEQKQLPAFDRVLVCTQADRFRLVSSGLRPPPDIIPNIVTIPQDVPQIDEQMEFRFLFVGNLGYFPNADAIHYFAGEILPLIRSQVSRPIALDIVGTGLRESEIRALSRVPGVRLLGFIPDVTRGYVPANAVIVPLRAGGGTRIKVLEAFAHRRPVVSTPEGVEGIDAVHEKHALIADTRERFAEACIRLIHEPALRRDLTRHALELVQTRYSEAVLAPLLCAPFPTNKSSL
jgi:glycosyltransferase involved in cell wall biosynthesis